MKTSAFTGLVVAMMLLFGVPAGSPLTFAAVPQEPAQGGMVPSTPELIRQVQFMLQTVGIDPGPIDGNAQALTNRAAHQFQFQHALPITDITNGGPISTAFLDLLRKEAGAKLGVVPAPPAQVAVTPPAPTPAPAAPVPTLLRRLRRPRQIGLPAARSRPRILPSVASNTRRNPTLTKGSAARPTGP